MSDQPLLMCKNLVKYFPVLKRRVIGASQVGIVHAVDNINFEIERGETLGLVGESGCGKTTTARTILYLTEPTAGEVFYGGRNLFKIFASKNKEEILELRRKMQLIFQDPYGSLNPRWTISDTITESFRVHKNIKREKWRDRLYELLEDVGLEEYHAERYPHEFSGGQRQRIGIARALSVNPEFIICDEPVSSLDVSVRAQILNLLADIQKNLKLTYLYISHDLSTVRYVSNRVAVMYLGKIVELADTTSIFENTLHPYAKALISAVPVPNPKLGTSRIILRGEVPSPINPPIGCRFHPRCPIATPICGKEEPEFRDVGGGHFVACHEV